VEGEGQGQGQGESILKELLLTNFDAFGVHEAYVHEIFTNIGN
jgi:hypothetical protein